MQPAPPDPPLADPALPPLPPSPAEPPTPVAAGPPAVPPEPDEDEALLGDCDVPLPVSLSLEQADRETNKVKMSARIVPPAYDRTPKSAPFSSTIHSFL